MTFQLLLRSLGRVLWFAIAGAIYSMIIGVFAGAVTGGLLIVILDFLSSSSYAIDIREGSKLGSITALYVSATTGFLAFAIVGCFACLSAIPSQVFLKTFLSTWRAAFVGIVGGSILGPLNALIFGRFFLPDFELSTKAFFGYIIGVIGGFIIGTFYGAIVGAKREIALQKDEKAALSAIESAAL